MFASLPRTPKTWRVSLALLFVGFCSAAAVALLCLQPVRGATALHAVGPAPADLIWDTMILSATVMPADGGVIADASGYLSISFPPHAVAEPLLVYWSTVPTASAPVDVFVRTLGSFALEAFNAAGAAQSETLAPWTMQFTYTDCAATGPCLLQEVDEASLRCRRLDRAQAVWLPVASHVNVITNRVTCSAAHFDHYALVADPLYTSGATSGTVVYLPLLNR